MAKKIISIPLDERRSVCITAIQGDANVNVETEGLVIISEPQSYPKREPAVHLADTNYGSLTVSPKGMNITAKIILPSNLACEAEFVNQIHTLYQLAARTNC